MDEKKERTIMCHDCATVECRRNYPGGIPAYCSATRFKDILEGTKTAYAKSGLMELWRAAGTVISRGYMKWPRIQEGIEFAKELKLKKIGIASCVSYADELRVISELFTGAGFEVVSAGCQIGRVPPAARGLKVEPGEERHFFCNPVAQAEIMNSQNTELNFLLGLCLGHDAIFSKVSKAPVSTLIVKDRVTGGNPGAAIYSYFHLRALRKAYGVKES